VLHGNGTVSDERGPKTWEFTAVNPSSAHAVTVVPHALCLQVQGTVQAHG